MVALVGELEGDVAVLVVPLVHGDDGVILGEFTHMTFALGRDGGSSKSRSIK